MSTSRKPHVSTWYSDTIETHIFVNIFTIRYCSEHSGHVLFVSFFLIEMVPFRRDVCTFLPVGLVKQNNYIPLFWSCKQLLPTVVLLFELIKVVQSNLVSENGLKSIHLSCRPLSFAGVGTNYIGETEHELQRHSANSRHSARLPCLSLSEHDSCGKGRRLLLKIIRWYPFCPKINWIWNNFGAPNNFPGILNTPTHFHHFHRPPISGDQPPRLHASCFRRLGHYV